jgi:hypothetical protein
MKPRRIKVVFAAMVTAIAVSPESLQTNAAALDNSSVAYAPAADIELHYSMPTLLAWASKLSGYPVPEMMPYVAYRPGAFFTDQVCGGNACKAVGWYNDQDIIYLAEKYRFEDQDDFANSLLLHELVHFLQHHSGRFDSLSCDDSLAREREAYAVQNDYLVNVWSSIRYIAPKPVSCAY